MVRAALHGHVTAHSRGQESQEGLFGSGADPRQPGRPGSQSRRRRLKSRTWLSASPWTPLHPGPSLYTCLWRPSGSWGFCAPAPCPPRRRHTKRQPIFLRRKSSLSSCPRGLPRPRQGKRGSLRFWKRGRSACSGRRPGGAGTGD